MKIVKLIFKNLFRHKLRTSLTILGISVAIMAFFLLSTIVSAWNAGVEIASVNRLITRHKVSFFLPLPISYKERILQIDGIKNVTWANWFQGKYKEGKFDEFFPRMAVDAETFFDAYPEFYIAPNELENFKKNRQACIVGDKLAEKMKFKIGDIIPIEGDIYPGKWEFVVVGIYKQKNLEDKTVDRTQMFFNWKYLDEQLLKDSPRMSGYVGWFIIDLKNSKIAGRVSNQVDDMFLNSGDPTKTETEKAFQQSFVSLSGAILTSLEIISYFIVGIILLVLVNTIAMSAREKIQEYAVLKTLGFRGSHIYWLISGEALFISIIGGIVGFLLSLPVIKGFSLEFPTMFPVFEISESTFITAIIFTLFVGISSSIIPGIRSMKMKIVDGLRQIG